MESKLPNETYFLASLLGEVKFHALRPSLKAVRLHKTSEAFAQIIMYLASAWDVCGTWLAFALVNTMWGRICMLDEVSWYSLLHEKERSSWATLGSDKQ